MRECAVVDIGSNTVQMCIYTSEGNTWRQVRKFCHTLELYSCVRDGVLTAAGEERLVAALREFTAILDVRRVAARFVFATAGFRKLREPHILCARLAAKTGWQIEVLSGEEEADCSFTGLVSRNPNADSGIMADMGGGSTELLSFARRTCTSAVSLPFGCVSLRRRFVAGRFPTAKEADALRTYVADAVRALALPVAQPLYLVGGTAKAMGALYHELYGDYAFEREKLSALLARFAAPGSAEVAMMQARFPDRVESAVAGMIAYGVIFEILAPARILVSGAGVREGYLHKLVQAGRL